MTAEAVRGNATITTLWGRADDGTIVRIEITGDGEVADEAAGRPGEWWPVMGLEHVVDGIDPVVTVAVDCRTPAGWDRLESDLALFSSERLAGLVAVHAGVIKAGDLVIVLPGPSFAGKTTLCAAALDAGYEVLSDEYALINPETGLIVGYPRRLRVRRPNGESERRPASPTPRPLAVTLVALLVHNNADDGRSAVLEVQESNPADIAMGLLANTVCARSRPEESFRAAIAVARHARGIGGTRGEAAEALLELVRIAELD